MKKTLCVALSFFLVISLLPLWAFADDSVSLDIMKLPYDLESCSFSDLLLAKGLIDEAISNKLYNGEEIETFCDDGLGALLVSPYIVLGGSNYYPIDLYCVFANMEDFFYAEISTANADAFIYDYSLICMSCGFDIVSVSTETVYTVTLKYSNYLLELSNHNGLIDFVAGLCSDPYFTQK